MRGTWTPGILLLGSLSLTVSACSTVVNSDTGPATSDAGTTAAPTTTTSATTTTTTTGAANPTSSTTASTTTSTSTTTTTSTSTTIAEVAELSVYEPACVVEVQRGDSLGLISDRFDDDTVTVASIRAENGIDGDTIYPGQLLDVCVGNGLDDITGEERTEQNAALVAASERAIVEQQQTKLNELFAGYGIPDLLVDGVSGPVTRQRLCAARVAFGLPASLADMEAGSAEEQWLLAAPELPIPFTSAIRSERWILIDLTCQILFAGEGAERLTFVFPTSTGEPGHETRPQDRTRAFRYNPALDNDGWHNSTTFPVEADNPLNGNMYRPLYFDRGQAIHGANNVPRDPQSKGCARLRVEHQDALVAWLGLDQLGGPTNDPALINVTVNVQGQYIAP
jgi:LysM repeat protein